MLSAPLSDHSDEVVEVFTGDTLEEAMAYAVASLGPDLTVRRARRVRKGVQGLRGKERYEVVAVPPARASADVVGNAFEALLAQAEQAEDATTPVPVRRTTRPARPDARPVVLEVVPELPAAAPMPPMPTVPPQARPARTPRPSQPVAAPRPASPAARRTGSEESWGRAALKELRPPRAVLAALPAKEPRTDVAWVVALTKAFATILPAPDPTAAVCISGAGLDGVRGILEAARKGMTPGTITYGGRTAPATATELALAVRAEVLR